MNITFENRKLEKIANDDSKMMADLGKKRAIKFKQRLDDLKGAATLEDVRHLPGNYHELTGNRKGQWACDLDQPYRLIFTPQEKPIPTDPSGKYIWMEINAVEIIEITDYH
ncbi:MAG: type II toxin-antitoxin system RelE/ParE family toxin [Chitinophagales bacterium]